MTRRFATVLLIVHLASSVVAAQSTSPAVPQQQVFVPAGTEAAYDQVHYAPVVRVGDLVVVSGVTALGPGEFEDQVRRMFDRIKTDLSAAGATMDDVVELQTFHRGGPDSVAFQAEFRRFRAVHDEYFTGHYPAWTAIGNVTLLAPNALVETRVTAIVGSGQHPVVHRVDNAPTTLAKTPSPGPQQSVGTGPARPDPAMLAPQRIDLASPVTVPADLIYAHRPTISVRINGKGPFSLSIETGGPYALALAPSVVATLGLKPDAGPFQLLAVDSVEIGGMTLRNLRARSTPGGQGPFPGADGLLGLAAYRDLLLTIDYPKSTVTFSRGALPAPNGQDVLALEPVGTLLAARADVGGRSIPLIVDTQSGGLTAMCNPELAQSLPFVDTPAVVGHAVVSGMTSQPIEVRQARLDGELKLGKYSLERPILDISPFPPGLGLPGPVCTMGSELLANFMVTLDEQNKRIRFSRVSTSVPAPSSRFSVGFSLEADGGTLVKVAAVAVDGPADHAGLRVGDIVRFIDSKPISQQLSSSFDLNERVLPGRPMVVTIERDGTSRTVHIEPTVLIR